MKKPALIASLKLNYSSFINFINSLSNEDYNYKIAEKWSADLHLDHLVLSTKALVYVFELDKTTIVEKFGIVDNQKRSYETIKSLYFEKLNDGGKAPDRFVPSAESVHEKSVLCKQLNTLVTKLNTAIESFSEEELDTLRIPHPLLGSLSLREMMYNAIYHAEHHQNLIIKILNT